MYTYLDDVEEVGGYGNTQEILVELLIVSEVVSIEKKGNVRACELEVNILQYPTVIF